MRLAVNSAPGYAVVGKDQEGYSETIHVVVNAAPVASVASLLLRPMSAQPQAAETGGTESLFRLAWEQTDLDAVAEVTDWTVVGRFTDEGGIAESEAWGDTRVVQLLPSQNVPGSKLRRAIAWAPPGSKNSNGSGCICAIKPDT